METQGVDLGKSFASKRGCLTVVFNPEQASFGICGSVFVERIILARSLLMTREELSTLGNTCIRVSCLSNLDQRGKGVAFCLFTLRSLERALPVQLFRCSLGFVLCPQPNLG